MNYHILEVNEKEYKLRFKNADVMEVEKKTGVKFLDFIQDYSVTTVTTLLRYAIKSTIPNFSLEDAGKLYDDLVDADYTLEDIVFKVIYETAVVSGFLKRTDLEEIMNAKEELKEKKKAEVLQK